MIPDIISVQLANLFGHCLQEYLEVNEINNLKQSIKQETIYQTI